jgi:hypothetical protein
VLMAAQSMMIDMGKNLPRNFYQFPVKTVRGGREQPVASRVYGSPTYGSGD